MHMTQESDADFVAEEVVTDTLRRFATGIFPVLRPEYIVDLGARRSAEDALKLTVPRDEPKLQAFIDARMQEFFKITRGQARTVLGGKHVGWILSSYYDTVREFLTTDTL